MVTLRRVDLEGKKSKINDFYKPNELDEAIDDESTCTKRRKGQNLKLQTQFSVKDLLAESSGNFQELSPKSGGISPKSIGELDVAAIKVQKAYKSYRTRRNLADCAVVCEELWWKALDFAALNRCSISYFDSDKSETAFSKWARAGTMAAKVGKGSLKDQKAQRLALRHWLEAIDPRHRYGHNLQFYYAVWFQSQSSQPFFYWLDVGDGKEANLDECPRNELQRQCIKYLGPKERQAYEVTIESGKLVYKQSQKLVHTPEGSKWIFVLSSSRVLYVGEKKKGQFQHSSFLAGGATIASGRLVALNGVLDAIWPYSGHYCPTEKTFVEFIGFLEEHNVDLTNVKKYPIDDDVPPSNPVKEELPSVSLEAAISSKDTAISKANTKENVGKNSTRVEASKVEEAKPLSWTWTTGVGPRIGCVREYPTKLQVQALEQLHLSPRVTPAKFAEKIPIPSPRPSPKIHLSPRLVCLGLQSPRPFKLGYTKHCYLLGHCNSCGSNSILRH